MGLICVDYISTEISTHEYTKVLKRENYHIANVSNRYLIQVRKFQTQIYCILIVALVITRGWVSWRRELGMSDQRKCTHRVPPYLGSSPVNWWVVSSSWCSVEGLTSQEFPSPPLRCLFPHAGGGTNWKNLKI